MTVRSGGFAPSNGGTGTPGRGIASAEIGPNGHLYVTYTDGSIMDAGEMPGVDIIVGDGPPPTAGSPGDLYLDAVSGDLYRMET